MFSQFGSTEESLSKASSVVFRIGTDTPLLDSHFDSEKVEALKRLLAMVAHGADVSSFFPQVVKNVASQSLELKKLVYLYLLHYAEKCFVTYICLLRQFHHFLRLILKIFFITSSDLYQMRGLKLETLSTIATDCSAQIILEEFQDYIKGPDQRFVVAIGLCAQRMPSVANICLEGQAGVMVEVSISIKAMIKLNPVGHEKIIVKLARNLDVIRNAVAHALIVWIVGEYCYVGRIIPKVVSTILQYLAKCFSSEELVTKRQILNTAAKSSLVDSGVKLSLPGVWMALFVVFAPGKFQ